MERLASGYISWQASVGMLEGTALLEARRSLLDRFPGSAETALEVAAGLRREIDCQAAIEVLLNLGEDAPAKAKVLLAQAYFDENLFGEASEVLAAMNLEAIEDVAVRAQANNIVRQCEEIKPLWEAELAVRAKEEAADNLPRVEIQTAKGSILIELFEDDAPNTVANFISLIQSDYYDGIAFHRFEPNFMIQGGCPNTKTGKAPTARVALDTPSQMSAKATTLACTLLIPSPWPRPAPRTPAGASSTSTTVPRRG